MSFTRWIIFASFTGGIIALSLQPSGFAHATSTTTFLVANPHSGSTQETQRTSPGMKKGMSGAESSGKMQIDKDAQSGSDRMSKNSKTIDQSRDQGGGGSQGSSEKDQNLGSGGTPGPLNPKNPGMSAETGTGNQ